MSMPDTREARLVEIGNMRLFVRIMLGLALTSGLAARDCAADSGLACEGCELRLGLGDTYHFWSRTGGLVIPATLTWAQGRYEVGLFKMATRQTLNEASKVPRLLAEPYWGVSASRRWKLAGASTWQVLFGFGVSYKSEADPLSVTRWNLASQLAMRLRLPGNGSDVELCVRHWSNGGIRLPNRGQDFMTVTYAF